MNKERNPYISFINGLAILAIIAIHLIDWSNLKITSEQQLFKQWLYPSVLFFFSNLGAVIYLAYAKKRTWLEGFKKTAYKGTRLIAIFFAYNLVKLAFFDFNKEPFFLQFKDKNILDAFHILSLKAFTVPITIILTLGLYFLISPLFILITKKLKYPKTVLLGIIGLILIINYLIPLPVNSLTDFIYARNNVTFSILYWLAPFVFGYYLALSEYQKHYKRWLALFGVLFFVSYAFLKFSGQSTDLTSYMYPLRPYYIFASYFIMFILMGVHDLIGLIKFRAVEIIFKVLKILGDATLNVYILHWVVIDLTLFYFFPKSKAILITVPIFLLSFIIFKWLRNKKREEPVIV